MSLYACSVCTYEQLASVAACVICGTENTSAATSPSPSSSSQSALMSHQLARRIQESADAALARRLSLEFGEAEAKEQEETADRDGDGMMRATSDEEYDLTVPRSSAASTSIFGTATSSSTSTNAAKTTAAATPSTLATSSFVPSKWPQHQKRKVKYEDDAPYSEPQSQESYDSEEFSPPPRKKQNGGKGSSSSRAKNVTPISTNPASMIARPLTPTNSSLQNRKSPDPVAYANSISLTAGLSTILSTPSPCAPSHTPAAAITAVTASRTDAKKPKVSRAKTAVKTEKATATMALSITPAAPDTSSTALPAPRLLRVRSSLPAPAEPLSDASPTAIHQAPASSSKPPRPPMMRAVSAPEESKEQEDNKLPYDHSPLVDIVNMRVHPPNPFIDTALQKVFAQFVSPPDAQGAIQSNVRSDSELKNFVDIVLSVVQVAGPRVLPTHIARGIWIAASHGDVTLRGVQMIRHPLSQLAGLSPTFFLPTNETWNEWCEECIKFSLWLQQKRSDFASDELRKQMEKRDNATAAASSSKAASSSSPAPPSIIDYVTSQQAKINSEFSLREAFNKMIAEERYYAKWCLVKFERMMAALELDERVRKEGEYQTHELDPLSYSPTPLLHSLILHATPILQSHRSHAEVDELKKVTGPQIQRTNEEEISLERLKPKKGGGRKKKVAAKPSASAAATSSSISSITDNAADDGEAADEDQLDRDDSFVHWWLSLLEFLGLQRQTAANHEAARKQNELTIATFQTPQCLKIYQNVVLKFTGRMQEMARQKARR